MNIKTALKKLKKIANKKGSPEPADPKRALSMYFHLLDECVDMMEASIEMAAHTNFTVHDMAVLLRAATDFKIATAPLFDKFPDFNPWDQQ